LATPVFRTLNDFFTAEFDFVSTNISSGHYRYNWRFLGEDSTGNFVDLYNTVNITSPAINYNSGICIFELRVRELVPTGGDIEIRSIAIERIKV